MPSSLPSAPGRPHPPSPENPNDSQPPPTGSSTITANSEELRRHAALFNEAAAKVDNTLSTLQSNLSHLEPRIGDGKEAELFKNGDGESGYLPSSTNIQEALKFYKQFLDGLAEGTRGTARSQDNAGVASNDGVQRLTGR